MAGSKRTKKRLMTFFPGVRRLSAKQEAGITWLNTEVLKAISYRHVGREAIEGTSTAQTDWSLDNPEGTADGFFRSVEVLAKLRKRLKEDAPAVVASEARKILQLLDQGIAGFVARKGGFQLPPFDDLSEAMLLGFAYADLHYVLKDVKSRQSWNELREDGGGESKAIAAFRAGFREYMSAQDSDGLIHAVCTIPKWRRADKGKVRSPRELLEASSSVGGVHAATVRALAIWRGCSSRTIENRLDLIGTSADEPVER